MRIEVTEKAQTDAINAFEHYHAIHPQLAQRFFAELGRVQALLADQPGMGRVGKLPGTREYVMRIFPCIVSYRVRQNMLQVLRIHNTHQQPPSAEQ